MHKERSLPLRSVSIKIGRPVFATGRLNKTSRMPCRLLTKLFFLSSSVSKHLLVAYWGQNSAGTKFPQNPEKDLKDVCAERKYDIIVIGFVVTFFGKNNKGK